MRFFLGPRKNGKGSIGFGSPALLRVRAEPEAREGFLGENPRTPCSKRSTRPRCRCVPRRERRDPKPCLEGPARLQRQNTPARPRSSLTATAPSLASTPPRSARACTSPSSSPARSSAKRYATPPPVPDRTFPPRGRAAVVSHGTAWRERSIIEKKSPLADSAPRGARFADPPSSECAGREQRFRRHVGVAQQGQAVQGHDHPRARGVRRSEACEACEA